MTYKLLSIGETAKLLGVSIDTLRRWDKARRLQSIRTGPRGHRYYSQTDIELFMRNEYSLAFQWAASSTNVEPEEEVYCQTRDIFAARLEKLQSALSHRISLDFVSLLTAVAGEIGNNSYDHNLGNWPDVPGIYFSYDMRNSNIILADRGQGILATLRRVKPELHDATTALKVAFTETISGRAPEARGNGLKFVRAVITENPFTLYFQTGDAYLHLKQHDEDVMIKKTETPIRGCLAKIGFEETV